MLTSFLIAAIISKTSFGCILMINVTLLHQLCLCLTCAFESRRNQMYIFLHCQGCPATKAVDMQLLLDSSGSVGASAWTQMVQMLDSYFVDAIFTNPASRLAVAKFGTETNVLQYVLI